ncbi:SLC13 family permease [Altererythrobacter sp. CAU 1778]
MSVASQIDGGGGKSRLQWAGLFAGAIAALAIQLIPVPEAVGREGWWTLSLLVLMATWWVTEALPIPVTSLLPLVVLPLAGVAPIAEAAAGYSSPIVMLLLGGFIIAKSVERWNLHTRIALNIVKRFGSSPSGLVAGFLIASALLSMWISNTATTIMLAPIALSVSLAILGKESTSAPLTVSILLAVAFGASIGGIATPVGTPTNLIIINWFEEQGDYRFTFARWMSIGVPVVAVMVPATWFVLARWANRLEPISSDAGRVVVERELAALGPWQRPERRVLAAFGVIAFLWIARSYVIQDLTIFGTQPFTGLTDHVIAIFGAVLMFLIPSGSQQERGSMLLDWETATQIPWGVILLFGGGLSLAAAITATGLAEWLGAQMSGLAAMPVLVIIAALVTFVIFATELTSNVATTSALMPVVGALAVGGGMDPALLALPVAMSASCAFMFPMATGPNAIVFASGQMSMRRMAAIGFRLNLLGIVLISLVVYALSDFVLA